MSAPLLEPSEILRRAHAVGTYYGFAPLSALTVKKRETGIATKAPPQHANPDSLDANGRDILSFLKRVHTTGHAPALARPLFLWHTNVAPGRPAPRQMVIQFHVLGADRAIADAVLMRAVRTLVADITKETPRLRVNSIGDKETRARLSRELTHFFRRRAGTLPPEISASAKTDVLLAAEMLREHEMREGLPSSTDHLSEASRKHFEAVLEYLESTDTDYELAPELMSRAQGWSETCFEIISNERVHAWGSRYGDLAKPFFKEASASVGAIIRIGTDIKTVVTHVRDRARPRFVFVHIGDEAKRESIKMADTLRRARVPMMQAIGLESLTEQMRFAEEHNPRYLIIMGRKEALERSVILRERETHSEVFIPLDSLIERLKLVA